MRVMAILAVLFLFSAVGVTYASTRIVEQQIGLGGRHIDSDPLVPDKKPPARKKNHSKPKRSVASKPAKAAVPASAPAEIYGKAGGQQSSPAGTQRPSQTSEREDSGGSEAEEEEREQDSGYEDSDD